MEIAEKEPGVAKMVGRMGGFSFVLFLGKYFILVFLLISILSYSGDYILGLLIRE